jgi:hypothetical protein
MLEFACHEAHRLFEAADSIDAKQRRPINIL